jgi:diguanylate cyclase (GGDEF)-like protein
VEKINLYEKLQQLAIYDFLTEVYNRRYFDLRFGEEFERAKNFNLNMSFLMIDVDDFKKINDTYGHLVGDAVLKETAALIKESVREIDFLARVGGEEFAAVLLDTDKGGAIVVGDRICVKIAGKLIKAFDEKLRVTVSVGIASFPQNTLYSDMLMETADKALYKAKREGKNRVGYF